MLTIKDLSVGQEVKAVVTRLEEYGILLRIEESKVVGLCHRTEVCGTPTNLPLVEVFIVDAGANGRNP